MKKLLIVTTLVFLSTANLLAQQDSSNVSTGEKTIKHQRNIFKMNLAALLLKNYSFQYERVLTKRLSVVIGYRTAPMSGIPFKNSILKAIGDDDPETTRQIENLQLGNGAITPELRLYVGKGYGRGFYFAPFYRHANYEIKGAEFTYDNDAGGESIMALNGKISSNTFGLVLGSQFFLSKHVTLDVCWLGPHYGSAKGTLTGTPSSPLSASEQDDIRKELNDIDIPVIKTTSNVTANSASLTLDGPFAGLRFGICLGIKF